MTVIAWDGHTIAADRMAVIGERRARVRKLTPLPDGVAAVCGDHHEGLLLVQWYLDGADPSKWPKFQDEEYTTLVIARSSGVVVYGKLPVANVVRQKFAWGSGSEVAMGAMYMGATAVQAVRAAISVNVYCGLGVDSYDIR